MKTFATSVVAAVLLTVAASAPALAGGTANTIELGSGTSCLPNAIRCKRGYRPAHPRCFTVSVRQNGTIQKKRVCRYN